MHDKGEGLIMIKKPYNATDKRMEYLTNAFAILIIIFFAIQIVEGYRWEYSVQYDNEGYHWTNEERYDSFSTILNILNTIMVLDAIILLALLVNPKFMIRRDEQ